jgi:hypothetical protein
MASDGPKAMLCGYCLRRHDLGTRCWPDSSDSSTCKPYVIQGAQLAAAPSDLTSGIKTQTIVDALRAEIEGSVAQAEAQAQAAEATKEEYDRVAAKAVYLLRVGEEPPITFSTTYKTLHGPIGQPTWERLDAAEARRNDMADECGRLATRERELLARIGEMQLEIDGLKRKARR